MQGGKGNEAGAGYAEYVRGAVSGAVNRRNSMIDHQRAAKLYAANQTDPLRPMTWRTRTGCWLRRNWKEIALLSLMFIALATVAAMAEI
jgi:hypothetical protein